MNEQHWIKGNGRKRVPGQEAFPAPLPEEALGIGPIALLSRGRHGGNK